LMSLLLRQTRLNAPSEDATLSTAEPIRGSPTSLAQAAVEACAYETRGRSPQADPRRSAGDLPRVAVCLHPGGCLQPAGPDLTASGDA
jgi:hypothetical protein